MVIWRNSLLMAVAVCQSQPSVDLTKDTLDELYDEYLYGREIMKKSKPPSLATMKIAERKFWREVALRLLKAKGKGKAETIENVVLALRKDTLFWQREVYDWCSKEATKSKNEKTKKKGDKNKGGVQKSWLKNNTKPQFQKGSSKGKKGRNGKGKKIVCYICGKPGHMAANCRLAMQLPQQGGSAQIPPPPAMAAGQQRPMAPKGVDGKTPCREFHGGNTCRFGTTCKFSHLCPVIKADGTICGGTHRAKDHR